MRTTVPVRLLFFAASLWCATTGLAGEPSRDSLKVFDAVRLVLEKNPAITQAEEQVVAADARVRQTESALSPVLGVEAGYAYLAPIAVINFGPEEFRLFPAHNYDAHISAHQQLYDFGKTTAVADLGRSRVQTARLGVQSTRYALAYQTIQVFNAILYLREAIAVQDDQIATLQEHINVTRKRVSAGSATDFDVLTTEVRVAAVNNQRIELVNAKAKAEASLVRLMGRSEGSDLPLTGSFLLTPIPQNTDSLIVLGFRLRPEIRTATNEEETSQLQVTVARSGDLPSLSVGVNYGFKNGLMPNLDVLRGSLSAGVKLSIPITEGGRTGHQEEEATASLRSSQARLADLKLQVALDVRQALSDLHSAADKVVTSDLQLKQAREALGIARKRYEAGTTTNLDLLDAETSVQQAGLLRLQALYAFAASRVALDRAIGTEPWQ
jgi:outer membrane protein